MGGRRSPAIAVAVLVAWGSVVTPAAGFASGARASVPGSLDPSFGNGGVVITELGRSVERADALVVQPDGQLIAAGMRGYDLDVEGTSTDFVIVRYDARGVLDETFGDGGMVATDFFGDADQAEGLALQDDGKIVAAGTAIRIESSGWTQSDIALARYLPDGSLDPSFGDGGRVTTDIAGGFDWARAVVVQPDGKLVVAGAAGEGGLSRLVLARYLPDGTPDLTFGTGGSALLDRLVSAASDLARQSDGKLVASGSLGDATGPSSVDFLVVRFLVDGTLDTGFGTGGYVTTDVGGAYDYANALEVRPDGTVVVAGTIADADAQEYDLALARYRPDGTLDRRFGRRGTVVTGGPGRVESAADLEVQPDGKLIAGGQFSRGLDDSDFALFRYRPDGTLDRRFGRRGVVTTDFAGSSDGVSSLVIQGRTVTAAGVGSNADSTNSDFALARYRLGPTGQPHA